MIRVNVHRYMDRCSVQVHLLRPDLGTKARPHPVEYLYWGVFEVPAHDETGAMIEMVAEALRECEMKAAERGGWSVLI